MLNAINSMSDQVSPSHVLRGTAEYISVLINGRCKLLTFLSSDIFRYLLHEGLQVLWEIFGVHACVIMSIGSGCLCRHALARDACGMDIR